MNEYNNSERVVCYDCHSDLGFSLHLEERKARRALRVAIVFGVGFAIALAYAGFHGWLS